MKYFKEWSKDKSFFAELTGLIIADGMQDYYEHMEAIRKGRRIEGDIPLPRIEEWLSIYDNEERMRRVVLNMLRSLGDDTLIEIVDLYESVNMISKMRPVEFEKMKREAGDLSSRGTNKDSQICHRII